MALLTRNLNIARLKGLTQCVSRLLNTSTPAITPAPVLQNYNNPWIYKQPEIIQTPFINSITPIHLPNGLFWLPLIKDDPTQHATIKAPAADTTEKQAARLIVIRRKKMKKHKLRKLRKRMKYEWAKIRQRRELKKEKEFQAGLIQQCKEAESFSAEKYVDEKLSKLHEVIVPKYWKGKRMPEFLIREKMGLPPKGAK